MQALDMILFHQGIFNTSPSALTREIASHEAKIKIHP